MNNRQPRLKLAAPVQPEYALQESMTRVLRLELAREGRVTRHGVMWYSQDIANYGGEVPAARIARGICPGIPDTFVLWQGRAHYIELKTLIGEFSDHQKSVATAILLCGGKVGACCSVEQVLECLDTWAIPRNRRVRFAA